MASGRRRMSASAASTWATRSGDALIPGLSGNILWITCPSWPRRGAPAPHTGTGGEQERRRKELWGPSNPVQKKDPLPYKDTYIPAKITAGKTCGEACMILYYLHSPGRVHRQGNAGRRRAHYGNRGFVRLSVLSAAQHHSRRHQCRSAPGSYRGLPDLLPACQVDHRRRRWRAGGKRGFGYSVRVNPAGRKNPRGRRSGRTSAGTSGGYTEDRRSSGWSGRFPETPLHTTPGG